MADLSGQQFGKWSVLRKHIGGMHNQRYVCQCACGGEGLVIGSKLTSGLSTQCRNCARARVRNPSV